MKTSHPILVSLLAVFVAAGVAQADWFPGDSHKMHYPQLPDPNGWDVDITRGFVADDWLCTASGPVDDIHFWLSWEHEQVSPIDLIWVRIYDNVAAGVNAPWSHPGNLLWDRLMDPTVDAITVRDPEFGDEGWLSPFTVPPTVTRPDHAQYFQVNIVDILAPFVQDAGNIYWLELHVVPEFPNTYAGWKTSLNHFEDDAVFENIQNYYELIDPFTGVSLDMAFVITPEPGALVLLLVGGGSLLLCRSHTRNRA